VVAAKDARNTLCHTARVCAAVAVIATAISDMPSVEVTHAMIATWAICQNRGCTAHEAVSFRAFVGVWLLLHT
jgi:hypothetical protein